MSKEAKVISAAKIFLAFKKSLKRISQDLDSRHRSKITMSLKTCGNINSSIALNKSQNLILKFLEDKSIRYNLKSKVSRMFENIGNLISINMSNRFH